MRCVSCCHLRKPGRVDVGYCVGREDLPPAYGANHPLRTLPDDKGESCKAWRAR